jgi:hypothetical protein
MHCHDSGCSTGLRRILVAHAVGSPGVIGQNRASRKGRGRNRRWLCRTTCRYSRYRLRRPSRHRQLQLAPRACLILPPAYEGSAYEGSDPRNSLTLLHLASKEDHPETLDMCYWRRNGASKEALCPSRTAISLRIALRTSATDVMGAFVRAV